MLREDVQKGLKEGTLLEGKLRINKKNRHDAYVTIKGTDDIFIAGMKSQNRALEGDMVVVKLLEGSDLQTEIDRVMENRKKKQLQNLERQKNCELSDSEEELEAELEAIEENRTFGEVVYIEQRDIHQVPVGTLSLYKPGSTADGHGRFIWFKPLDKRTPFIQIPRETAPGEFLKDPASFENILCTCVIKKWSESSQFPLGSYTGTIGQMGEIPVETEALLVAAGIHWDTFSEQVLDTLPPTPWSIPEEEIQKRIDLRKERIFSIDPPTARDLDDAVSCKPIGNGLFEIGVHIADVSYFVKEGSILNKAAYERATSVYLVQKVIPMLPRLYQCYQNFYVKNYVV